jgi:Yip1 domain
MRRLATILIKPRETMRAILDSMPDRMLLPLIVLTTLSSIFGNYDRARFQQHGGSMQLGIVLLFVIGFALVVIGLFYVFSWVAHLIATRVFQGTGTRKETLSAFAWGFTPVVWALLYRVPAAIFFGGMQRSRMSGGDGGLTFDASIVEGGCAAMLFLSLLELAVVIGTLIVQSHTLGEAHRFSSWRGLATFLMTCAAPFVVVLAALLSSF